MSCAVFNKDSPQEVEVSQGRRASPDYPGRPPSGGISSLLQTTSSGLRFIFRRVPAWQIKKALRENEPLELSTSLTPIELQMVLWYFICNSDVIFPDPRVDTIYQIQAKFGQDVTGDVPRTFRFQSTDSKSSGAWSVTPAGVELLLSIAPNSLDESLKDREGCIKLGRRGEPIPVSTSIDDANISPSIDISTPICCDFLTQIVAVIRKHPKDFSEYQMIEDMLLVAYPCDGWTARGQRIEIPFGRGTDYAKELANLGRENILASMKCFKEENDNFIKYEAEHEKLKQKYPAPQPPGLVHNAIYWISGVVAAGGVVLCILGSLGIVRLE